VNIPSDSSFLEISRRYQQSLERLIGRMNYERTPEAAESLRDFKLNRMAELLARLGNPQQQVPAVHVAGSKGKGSTATMIATIFQAAGCRVGLFTSPHIDRFEDRFMVNALAPSPAEVVALFDQIWPVCEEMDGETPGSGPSFFDLATAMGWLHFARSQVDLAVIEVGLGGRLDSTNVCRPLVSVITSISRDHVRLLGETLELIAREKAGIIKPEVPVVTGVTQPGPLAEIVQISRECHSPLFRLGQEFSIRQQPVAATALSTPAGCRFDYAGLETELCDLETGMPGEHQTRNAALAVTCALLLNQKGYTVTPQAIAAGIRQAMCSLRVEKVSESPLIIVDAAHNVASIQALCETLQPVQARRRTVIFATSRDKEPADLLALLTEHFDEIWLTRFSNNPRSTPLEELEALASQVVTKPWKAFPELRSALDAARQTAGPEDLICVTGSFFLGAEAKNLLQAAREESIA
jgi:dihydrofolate synthase/folylpolyglutamate synthase